MLRFAVPMGCLSAVYVPCCSSLWGPGVTLRGNKARRRLTFLLLLFLLLAFGRPAPAATDPVGPAHPAQKKGEKKGKKKKEAAAAKRAEEDVEEEEEEAPLSGVRFAMKRHPTLVLGENVQIRFRAKLQADFRGFSPDRSAPEKCDPYSADAGCLFEMHRIRVGAQGTVLKYFELEVERELRVDLKRAEFEELTDPQGNEFKREITDSAWRDVFVNFRRLRAMQVQVGKFKVPFSMDALSGDSEIDFIHRSRIAEALAPGRDQGIMLHGRFLKRGLNYQAGLFKHDGDNALLRNNDPTGERAFAGRLFGTPFRLLPLPSRLKNIQIGGAFVSTTVPEGLKGLRGRNVVKDTFFSHMFVHGQRLRLGAEAVWNTGPFSLKGEFIHLQEERRGQGLRGENLPDLVSRGWYASGAWLLTGERQGRAVSPRHPWLLRPGIGALEVNARYEQLRFGSAAHLIRPSRSLRAEGIP